MGVAVCIRRTLSNCAPFYSAGGHQNIGPGGVIIVEEPFQAVHVKGGTCCDRSRQVRARVTQ